MIINDDSIRQEAVENYSGQIKKYFEENYDTMTARNILAQRKVGADVEIDIVEEYDRAGPGAQIVPKGGTPDKLGVKMKRIPFPMYQIMAGFSVNAKDLKIDAKTKSRKLEIGMADVQRKENDLAINGSTLYGINGIVDAAAANANGVIAASGGTYNNLGAWSGESTTDIYADVLQARDLLDAKFKGKQKFLLGNTVTMGYLDRMNSERIPYAMEIASLFNKKNVNDTSWKWIDESTPSGYAYLVTKDIEAGEFVVSENPGVTPYAMAAGQNYPYEISEWATPEIHDNQGFVQIAIT